MEWAGLFRLVQMRKRYQDFLPLSSTLYCKKFYVENAELESTILDQLRRKPSTLPSNMQVFTFLLEKAEAEDLLMKTEEVKKFKVQK